MTKRSGRGRSQPKTSWKVSPESSRKVKVLLSAHLPSPTNEPFATCTPGSRARRQALLKQYNFDPNALGSLDNFDKQKKVDDYVGTFK